MAKIQISTDSDLPADTVLAAITDFSSRRPKLWPNIDPGIYKVHEVGADWADVTEGSKIAGGVWARERYEWSAPGVVRATVQDSNIFKSGFWEMKVSTGDGGSHIEILQDRRAKGFKGHLLGGMMTLIGRRAYRQGLDKTLAILREEEEEARGSSPAA
jgi:Polyketide cyclase / dehydrase and lipid transport